MSLNLPTCPTGCDSYLVGVDFNFCDPEVHFGEIDHVYLKARDGSDLLDWESLTVWNTRLALDPTTDLDAIVDLHVIGDQPPAETEELEISLGRKIQTPSTHVLNIEIDDVTDTNYTLMRWLECNLVVDMWFSAGDVLFGGNPGIEANIMLKHQIERGQKSIHKIVGTIKWESKFSPPRTTNPMA